MLEKLSNDIKIAMKEKNREKLDALRYLKSMLIENSTSKNPRSEMDVVTGHYKKLKDSIDTFPQGHAARDKVAKELEFLVIYLPKQLSEDEVTAIIDEIISSQDNPNIGSVMKELSPKIKGAFDGKTANALVRKKLG